MSSSTPPLEEKHHGKEVVNDHAYLDHHSGDEEVGIVNKSNPLSRDLKGRHMQMIAMGEYSPDSGARLNANRLSGMFDSNSRFCQVAPLALVFSSAPVVRSKAVGLPRSSSAT
jgi:hypothetical protein